MSLDDRSLREHLDRRAEAGVSDVEGIADVVMSRVAQAGAGPWWHRLGVRRQSLGVAVAAIVVVVVAMAVLPSRLGPGPGTSASPTASAAADGYPIDRALTVKELDAVLGSDPAARAGEIVIAYVTLETFDIRCLGTRCPRYLVDLDGRQISVYDPDEAEPELPDPSALRIRSDGALDLLGHVRAGPDGLAWTLPQLTAELPDLRASDRAVPFLYLADAWRAVSTSAYRCLATVAAGDPDFGCGTGVAWLVPDEASLPSDFNSAPAGSLRVPNVTGVLTRSDALKRHGYWLVDPLVAQDEATCFLCPPAGAADLIGRVPTLDELELMPPETAAPPETTAPPVDVYPAERPLSAAELDALLFGLAGDVLGRTLVADVELSPRAVLCDSSICPDHEILLPGRAAPVTVLVDSSDGPVLDGPYALRVKDIDTLELVAAVRPASTGLAWTLPDYLAVLPDLLATDRLMSQAYLVEATAVRARGAPYCALQTRPPLGLDFGCGWAAWLVPVDAEIPSEGLSAAPDGGVRIQNDPGIEWPGEGPSVTGYFLVRPVDVADCFLCTPGATSQLLEPIEQIAAPTSP